MDLRYSNRNLLGWLGGWEDVCLYLTFFWDKPLSKCIVDWKCTPFWKTWLHTFKRSFFVLETGCTSPAIILISPQHLHPEEMNDNPFLPVLLSCLKLVINQTSLLMFAASKHPLSLEDYQQGLEYSRWSSNVFQRVGLEPDIAKLLSVQRCFAFSVLNPKLSLSIAPPQNHWWVVYVLL